MMIAKVQTAIKMTAKKESISTISLLLEFK
jgi:hypothetical protein